MQHQVCRRLAKAIQKLAIDIFRYVEKLPGQFLSDSQCEKLPVEICGAGCTFEEGPEKCHNKVRTGTLEHYKESERPLFVLLHF